MFGAPIAVPDPPCSVRPRFPGMCLSGCLHASGTAEGDPWDELVEVGGEVVSIYAGSSYGNR